MNDEVTRHQAESADLPKTTRQVVRDVLRGHTCWHDPALPDQMEAAIGSLIAACVAQALAPPPVTHGKAWEDRLNIICLCGKVCSGVIRKNPAGGFIGRPGSDTYVDPPAAQVFANHLWEMSHPPVVSPPAEHVCDSCEACILNGNKCCGCYDGACCQEVISSPDAPTGGGRS